MVPSKAAPTGGWTGRLRGVALAGGVLAVVALAAGALAARSSDGVVEMITRVGPVRSARPTPPLEAPTDLVAILGAQRLVARLDAVTGRQQQILASVTGADDGVIQGLSLSPDRRTVFYAVDRGCGEATISTVPTDGRTGPEVVAHGVSPAVSPDGRSLAYATVDRSSPEGASCFNVLVVRDLRDGAERRWHFPQDEYHDDGLYQASSITKIAWASDSRRVAFTLSYEGDSVAVLDVRRHRDLGQSTEVVIPGGGGDSRHPTWQAFSGRLAVVNRAFECCYDDTYSGPPRTLIVDVDRRHAEPLLPPEVVPTWLDFDATGRHLLYVDDGRLYRRTADQPSVALTAGVTAADW